MPVKHQSKCYRYLLGRRYENYCDLIMGDDENKKAIAEARRTFKYVRVVWHSSKKYQQVFVAGGLKKSALLEKALRDGITYAVANMGKVNGMMEKQFVEEWMRKNAGRVEAGRILAGQTLQRDLNFETGPNGLTISTIHNDRRVKKLYQGYSKKAAIKLFLEHLKTLD